MDASDVLSTSFDQIAPLHRPVLVLALRGWFDSAEVASGALHHLLADRPATIVAGIDPDPFFDFTQERPEVRVDADSGERHISWPANDFQVARFPGHPHDLVVLNGVEPHLRYSTFAECVLTVARSLECEIVVTLGAIPEAIPHTRAPIVVSSSTNESLVRALGLSRPRYQGVTGLVGVLQERLDRAGLPAVSLRVGVPHYLGNARHPRSSLALLAHLEHVLGVPTGHGALHADVERWQSLHDEAVAEDVQAQVYVTMLEREYERQTESRVIPAEDLGAELERFLRDQRDHDGSGED